MDAPGFVIGNVAKGRDFWDREHEVQAIWKALEKGSVLLKAPRRFGKTSVMYSVYENPAPDCKTFFLDTEGMGEPQDFISALITKSLSDSVIRKKAASLVKRLSGLFEKIEEIEFADVRLKLKEKVGIHWQEQGTDLIKQLSEYEGNVLFVVDELPMLVQNIARKSGPEAACDFLNWFRALRQTPEMGKVRWLAGGSIGIEHVLNMVNAGVKTINDFEMLKIGPFSVDVAAKYIRELLINEGKMKRISPDVIKEFLHLIGAPVPYFIQILVKESLYEMERRGAKTLSGDIIKKAYREEVLGPASRTYFEHYFTRLKDYYDDKMEHVAKRLILEVARNASVGKSDLFKLFRIASQGNLSDEVFSYLMTDLENDFYVIYDNDKGQYYFSTNILRDWWLRYHDLVEE